MKSTNRWVCFWLGVIALLLLCGVFFFPAFIYKFDPLSTFAALFNTDANVIWSAISVIVTSVLGIITINVSKKLANIQKKQAKIEIMQSLLYTQPHILIDALTVKSAEYELSEDRKMIKSVKGIDFPFYLNILDDDQTSNFSVLVVTIVNTSQAFARFRFDNAIIAQGEEKIAEYNGSTFGIHKNHVMLDKGNQCKIGLIISNKTLLNLNHKKITFTSILDNNFNESFRDIQSYQILNICDDDITFMPCDLKKNTFTKIER